MQLGFAGRNLAFQHLLDQVNAATWAIQLITQQLVSGAGGRAKAAMHTLAQNGFGLTAFNGVFEFRGQIGLHIFFTATGVRVGLCGVAGGASLHTGAAVRWPASQARAAPPRQSRHT